MMVAAVVVFSRRGKERRNGRREEEKNEVSRRKIKGQARQTAAMTNVKKKPLYHTLSLTHTYAHTLTTKALLRAASVHADCGASAATASEHGERQLGIRCGRLRDFLGQRELAFCCREYLFCSSRFERLIRFRCFVTRREIEMKLVFYL